MQRHCFILIIYNTGVCQADYECTYLDKKNVVNLIQISRENDWIKERNEGDEKDKEIKRMTRERYRERR